MMLARKEVAYLWLSCRELGTDQQGRGHQELDVKFEVQQKRSGRAPAQRMSFQSREQRERQRCKQRHDDDALLHQCRIIVREMRAMEEREEPPRENEREVPRILKKAETGSWSPGFHLVSPPPSTLCSLC